MLSSRVTIYKNTDAIGVQQAFLKVTTSPPIVSGSWITPINMRDLLFFYFR